jgi:hypothetical protein
VGGVDWSGVSEPSGRRVGGANVGLSGSKAKSCSVSGWFSKVDTLSK